MNFAYLNAMSSNVVSTYWHAKKVRFQPGQFRDKIPEICELAIRACADANPLLKEAGEKLMAVLISEGVDAQAMAKTVAAGGQPSVAPGPSQAKITAVATGSSGSAGSQLADWREFERLVVDLAGPVASSIIAQARSTNPSLTPRQAARSIDLILGDGIVSKALRDYSGR